jgi:hypothetical protein
MSDNVSCEKRNKEGKEHTRNSAVMGLRISTDGPWWVGKDREEEAKERRPRAGEGRETMDNNGMLLLHDVRLRLIQSRAADQGVGTPQA